MSLAPKASQALDLEERRAIFQIAREATEFNNPLVYRDALDRIARIAAFGGTNEVRRNQ